MRTPEERSEDFQVIQAMKRFGGGFMKTLAELCFRADSDNIRRIKQAWPEYWSQYGELAKSQREKDGEQWWDKP